MLKPFTSAIRELGRAHAPLAGDRRYLHPLLGGFAGLFATVWF
jgi:hypothetical protein